MPLIAEAQSLTREVPTQFFKKIIILFIVRASQVALVVRKLPPNAGDITQSLGSEDPLEEGMATHSSILAWGISGREEPGGL